MGFSLSRLEIDRVYRQMVALADANKSVTDAQLVAIAEQVRSGQEAAPVADPARRPAPVAESQPMAPEVGTGTECRPRRGPMWWQASACP